MSQSWYSSPSETSFDQLRRGLDELFERVGAGPSRRAGAFPPMNLFESEDGFVLTAELPGVKGDDIEIAVEGNRVTVRGERKIDHPSDASVHRLERQSGAFRRTLELPVEIDAEKAEAVHRHGVLMLRIPKAPEHQPRRINVQSS